MADFNELAKQFTAIGCLKAKMQRTGGTKRYSDVIKIVEDAFDRLDRTGMEAAREVETEVQKMVAGEVARRKKRADLAAQAQMEMTNRRLMHPKVSPIEYMMSLLSLNRSGVVRGESVELTAKDIAARTRSIFADFLFEYRDRVFSREQNFTDVVRAAFGEPASERGKLLAEGIGDALEYIRKEAGRYGFEIDKLSRYLPQTHDSAKIRGDGSDASRDTWKAFVSGRLDRDRMISFKTQQKMTEKEIDDLLNKIWQSIKDNERNHIQPNGLAKRDYIRKVENERILHFKDADGWLSYQQEYGEWNGNLFDNLASYIEGLSRDIAMVKHFGPNPSVGAAHLYREARELAKRQGDTRFLDRSRAPTRFINLFNELSGDAHIPDSALMANAGANVRNTMVASMMGSSFFMALSDIGFTGAAAKMAGMSATSTIGKALREFANPDETSRRVALQTGYVSDVFAYRAGAEQRILGEKMGANMTRLLADRVLRISLMKPWTEAAKASFVLEMAGHFTRLRGRSWGKLDNMSRSMLQRYGMNEADWYLWRTAQPSRMENGAEFILAADVIRHGEGSEEARRVASQFSAMIQAEQDIAVPHPGARERAALRLGQRPGTATGETVATMVQLKSFPVTMASIMINRMIMDKLTTFPERFAPLGWFFVGSSLVAGMGLQANELSKGRKPRDMDEGQFWVDAAVRGGGFGIFADILYQAANRGSPGLSDMLMGPTLPGILDTVGELPKLAGDGDFREREVVRFINNFVPGRTLWFSALAYERMITDTVIEAVDPEAHKYFRNREKYARQKGTEYWAPPGENLFESFGDLMR